MEKVRGEGFCSLFQEINGETKISLLIVALISSANYHLIYCMWLQYDTIEEFNVDSKAEYTA